MGMARHLAPSRKRAENPLVSTKRHHVQASEQPCAWALRRREYQESSSRQRIHGWHFPSMPLADSTWARHGRPMCTHPGCPNVGARSFGAVPNKTCRLCAASPAGSHGFFQLMRSFLPIAESAHFFLDQSLVGHFFRRGQQSHSLSPRAFRTCAKLLRGSHQMVTRLGVPAHGSMHHGFMQKCQFLAPSPNG